MPTYSRYSGAGGGTTYTFVGVAPITITNVAGTVTVSMTQSNATTDGWLSFTDWNTFNSKQSALTFGNLTEATSSVLTITGGTGAVIGSGTTIQVSQSSALTSGYLSSTDWSTFNNKVTSVGATAPVASSGGTTPTISMTQSGAAADGWLSSTDWNTFNSKQTAGNYITALTGEVTATGPGSVAATITNSAVTNAKLANMPALTIKGNNTGSPAAPLDLTATQTTAILDVMTAASVGSGGLKGLVPSSLAGDQDKYLRADATWQTIPSPYPAFTDDRVLYSAAAAAEWRVLGTGSSTAAYPSNTVIVGRLKPASITGANTVIIGASTVGNALTTGSENTIIGTAAATTLSTGNYNVAIGYAALASSNSSSCVAVGLRALEGTVGSNNVGIGQSGGYNLGARNNSIYIGVNTGDANVGFGTGDNRIAIGNGTLVAPNSMAVGGSSSPINKIVFGKGQFDVSNTAGMANTNVTITTTSPRTGWSNVDASAGTITISPAQGTGNGPGGDFIVSTAPAGASGTTLNAYVERLRVTAAGETRFAGSTSGYVGISSPAAPTSYSLVLPSAQGAADTILANNGSGTLSWQYAGLGAGSLGTNNVIVGRSKPSSITTANNSILIGSGSGNVLSTSTDIVAIGTNSLAAITTGGTGNVAVGSLSGQNLTADSNTSIGYAAMQGTAGSSNTAGSTAVGWGALRYVTTGIWNTMVGFSAGAVDSSNRITTGQRNSGYGAYALGGNITGQYNIGIGYAAHAASLSGNFNIVIGNNSCNSVGAGKLGFGSGAGNILIGDEGQPNATNTSYGIGLGYRVQFGANEFAVGSSTAQINTMLLGRGGADQTAANAVKIMTQRAAGTNVDLSAGTLTLAGSQSTGSAAGGDVIIATAPAGTSGTALNAHVERMRVTAAGNVGIGTSTPTSTLHLRNDANALTVIEQIQNRNAGASAGGVIAFINSGNDLSDNRYAYIGAITTGAAQNGNHLVFAPNASGASAVEAMRITSAGNVGIGTATPESAANFNILTLNGTTGGAVYCRNNGTNKLRILCDSGAGYVYAMSGTPLLFGANDTERMRITSDGEVYIAGTTDQGAYNLQCNGTGVWGAGAYVNGSDRRLKENIQDLESGLDVVEKLKPVTFQYKEDYSKDTGIQPGFIAQDLQEALVGKDYLNGIVQAGPNFLNVAYQNLIPILAKAIQELKEISSAQAAKIAELEAKLSATPE